MQTFDVRTIAQTVGVGACARGLEYAERGAVTSLSESSRPGQHPKIVGMVQGSERTPYTVVVTAVPARAGVPGIAFGVCTCPVRNNCKHVAAVMYAAGRPAADAPARPERSGWEAVLGAGPAEVPVPAWADQTPVALLVEPSGAASGRRRLAMRPVLLGDRGRWVRSGISWSDAAYGFDYRGFPRPAVRLLTEIAALAGTGAHYGRGPAVLDLDTFPSGRIWDVLAEAPTAALPLISSTDGTPVALSADPVLAGVDLADVDGDWTITPEWTAGGVPLDGEIMLLGDPAHGLAWWTDDAGTGALHLGRLARPLDPGDRRLMTVAEPVIVPAAEHSRFLRDFLPMLRGRLELASRDGTVEIPAHEPGRLTLAVTQPASRRLALAWSWHYRIGDETVVLSLDEEDRPDLRDRHAERESVVAAVRMVSACSRLRSWGPFGPKLAPTAELSGAPLLAFAREVLPALQGSDLVDVLVADDVAPLRETTEAPVVTVAGAAESGTDWFDMTVTVTVDGQDVPFAELFRALATDQEFMILESGTYFSLDRPELRQLRALIEESRALADPVDDRLRISRFQATYWAELEALGVLDEQAAEWSRSVRDLARITEIPEPELPAGLDATLRPYQRAGYTWLSFLYDNQLGGVLADDMGLGKTIQALALICKAREDKPGAAPFLVVAPTSVVGNWATEAHRFAPGLRVAAITETESRRGVPLDEVCAGADLVVTSYALFRLEFDGYAALGWSGLVVDEAQQIKNHQSKGYQCVRTLPAPFKLAITGTPMENNLTELWAIVSIGAPGLLADPARFAEYYRVPIERARDADRLDQLRRRIRPLLMRRTKQEVIADLPPKTEQVIELDLEPGHRRVYQRYLQRERRKVLGLLSDMDRNRFQIFRSLTLLRQAALDPALVDAENAGVASTKLDAMMQIVAGAAGEGHRILVFSQFTRFLDGARRRLDAAGIEYCYLDGKTRNRGAVLTEFKTGAAPVFLISLKAGGVGLNLTEADYCVLLDPWWNPATEAQAVDRAHRIGQDKPVMVYRLVARDTIEDKVMALKARKAALFSSIMADGGAGAAGLTARDIRGLLE